MKSVLVALHIVACQPDLLICKDMADDGLRWTDISHCTARKEDLMSSARSQLPAWAVVMARCRYLIGRDGRSLQVF
ncbi:hypothetical protein DYI23_14235 [Roseibium polysiphoniae]|uniref:Uncharacterized protein n=1 Tax=Roseibium polysiphoniae TaxID=2571221 RepID=A0A944CEV7_9HYPH|nr:hypothetical protein [Roseibium polysiphoniae]